MSGNLCLVVDVPVTLEFLQNTTCKKINLLLVPLRLPLQAQINEHLAENSKMNQDSRQYPCPPVNSQEYQSVNVVGFQLIQHVKNVPGQPWARTTSTASDDHSNNISKVLKVIEF